MAETAEFDDKEEAAIRSIFRSMGGGSRASAPASGPSVATKARSDGLMDVAKGAVQNVARRIPGVTGASAAISTVRGMTTAVGVAGGLAYAATKAVELADRANDYENSLQQARHAGLHGVVMMREMSIGSQASAYAGALKDVQSEMWSAFGHLWTSLVSWRRPIGILNHSDINMKRALTKRGIGNHASLDELERMRRRVDVDLGGHAELMMGWKRAPMHGG